ncbi:hypothetical protein K1X80_10025 [Pseudomonas sp. So3.2b]|uniref:hypothetical protein n=1 Tax=Pseudomonas sp. So3.2b TaxID=2864101 RepID=UPI001C691D7F|nr:hypothetical protein [Pseudomonas sp. So3.2b]QYM70647.1 hypothetical protein K1X80_10025 [Pseudomonas sp. So3.2b]
MSLIGDLAFSDQRTLEQDSLANPATTLPEPGFWDGSGTALFSGIGQGLAQLTLQAAQYGNDPTQMISLNVESDEDNLARREHIGDMRNEMTERMRPDAATSGTAAQVLFGLGDAGSRFAFGLASGGMPVGALTAGTSMGEQRFAELKGQGVDTKTAAIAGAIEGGVIGVGAFLPAARLFSAPAVDLAATAGANVGLGIAARGGVGAVLEKNGYTQQSQQYKALDATGLAVDGLLGGLFWGAGRAMTRGVLAGEADAALTANNGLHHQHGTAPGAPVDARSSIAHQAALDQAIAQLGRGEPVNLGGIADDATFIRADQIGPRREVIRQQAEQEVFAAARAELEPVAATGLPNVRDLRTELGTLQKTVDGLDGTYRESAKSFQRQGMSRKQAERAARDGIAEQRQAAQGRIGEINQALDGNRAAERAGADLAAMDRGQVPGRLAMKVDERAEQIGSAFKRTALASSVSPDHGAALMRAAGKEMEKLLREGGHIVDDIKVSPSRDIDIGAPAATARSDGEAPRAPESTAPPDLSVQPEGARADTEQQGQLTQEAPVPSPEQIREPSSAAADPLADIDAALPALVDSIVSGERDVQIPTGAFNEDGSAVTVSAREMLAEADGNIARAENDSKGFLAAALCALRFGN